MEAPLPASGRRPATALRDLRGLRGSFVAVSVVSASLRLCGA